MKLLKDAKPEETVLMIRGILKDLGIDIIEEQWVINYDNLYSVILRVPGTEYWTNGKGTSVNLALASAYGEFMERLQNNLLFNRYCVQTKSDIEPHMSKFEDISNLVKNELLCNMDNTKVMYECEFFFNISKETNEIIPKEYLLYFLGSNGVCAGNSQEEALTEGISEILERFVNKKIIFEGIVPPTIGDGVIKRLFPQQYTIIEKIKESGKTIIVKDCSLNLGLPVLCVILIDKDRYSYFVKFGSHPDLRIALTRCITEMYQGKYSEDFKGLSDFNTTINYAESFYNFKNVFRSGEGVYPNSFFSNSFSYQSDLKVKDFSNNKTCFEHLKRIVEKKLQSEILVKDNSVFGFNTYQVVIPGISEIIYNKKGYFKVVEKENEIKSLVKNIKKCSATELENILNYFENKKDMWEITLVDFLHLPISRKSPFYYATISFLLGNICIKLNKFQKASKFINHYIEYLERKEFDSESLNYFKVFRDYSVCQKEQINMELFYDERIINLVKNSFENIDLIFSTFPAFDGNCGECSLMKYCYNNVQEKFHKKRKKVLNEGLYGIADNLKY